MSNATRTDEELMALLTSTKDEAYFNELHRRYRDDVLRYVGRVNPLADEASAEDVVQQTFLKVHTSHDTFDPALKFRAWLFSIAANFAINQKVLHKRKHTVSFEAFTYSSGADLDTRQAYDPEDYRESQPEDIAEDTERSLDLRAKIGNLRGPQQEVIERLYYQGMTSEEAAVDLGIPLGTVRSQLSRALESLRAQFGDVVSKAA